MPAYFQFGLYCIKVENSQKSNNFNQNLDEPQLDNFLQFRIGCIIKIHDYFNCRNM